MAASSSSSSYAAAVEVDAAVWLAVAGSSVQIPSVYSNVYYFPQGHLEHSSASPFIYNFSFALKRPVIPCQVLSVRFLSNPSSDQVFVKFLLMPVEGSVNNVNDDNNNQNGDVVSFVKVLTPSDANSGGGFSVPRFCADLVLPQLDFATDTPVQNLTMSDTLNNAWEFRHVFRGTPRRHLLTTGWSKFVNAKRLVAGDSVVFMRKRSTNELFVGIRRNLRFSGNDGRDGGQAFEAIENAIRGIPFEVVYYPKVGWPDFVVRKEKVRDALQICWTPGMRVRMALETDDLSRTTRFHGTVAAVSLPNSGPWCGSPWRMLQVSWDVPETLQNANRVSPWQVEHVRHTPENGSTVPASKRFRFLQDPGMLPDGDGEYGSHVGPSSSRFSAGLQGPRRDQICISGSPDGNRDQPNQRSNELPRNEIEQGLGTVPTVLGIGGSNSGHLSAGSQGSVHSNVSFRLFGKIIQTSGRVGGGSQHNVRCTCRRRTCKNCNESPTQPSSDAA